MNDDKVKAAYEAYLKVQSELDRARLNGAGEKRLKQADDAVFQAFQEWSERLNCRQLGDEAGAQREERF